MPVSVLYPKVSLEELRGRISRWLVSEGESVVVGQVIFEIDNDKAAVAVEAPAAGTLQRMAPEGSIVEVGAEVAYIVVPGEVHVNKTIGTTQGMEEITPVFTQSGRTVISTPAGTRRPNPTPLARRIARESGIVLDDMPGTGPRGRVQKKDVLALLAKRTVASGLEVLRGSETGGLNAAWLRRGEGMPLVLIHGFSADLNSWRGFIASGSADSPVLALDLPGHGLSPRQIPADLDSLAVTVEETMTRLGVKTGILVGHSFGGAAAVRVAARGQADVRGVCLFAPAGLGPEINGTFIDGILRARSAASLRPWLQLLVHNPAVISEAFVSVAEAQRDDEGLIEAMRAFAGRFMPDSTQCVSILDDLAGLRMPVRVLFGRQDRILPFSASRSLPANVGLHAFNACGHMPHLEFAEQSHRILAELIRSTV